MIKKILSLFTAFFVIFVIIVLLAMFAWLLFKIPTPFSKPIDCMPRPRIDSSDEKDIKPDLREGLFGTMCATY